MKQQTPIFICGQMKHWPKVKPMQLNLLSIVFIGFMCALPAHAQDTKTAALPLDLIELLGELGDDEADLDAAMSDINNESPAKKPQIIQPTSTENSNKGAKQ